MEEAANSSPELVNRGVLPIGLIRVDAPYIHSVLPPSPAPSRAWWDHAAKLHIKIFKHPVSLLLMVWGTLPLPKLQDRVNPLGQTIPFLLTPPRR